jgi:hypothetical protein
MTHWLRAIVAAAGTATLATVLAIGTAFAQPGRGGPDVPGAHERALLDLTGQWVSVVNEDWLWRMVTPPAGDTASVPLNQAGRRVALEWDLEADRAAGRLCRAFGPPGLIRQPTRIRIGWQDDNTLRMDFDAGTQTRLLHFDTSAAMPAASAQGYSVASWTRTTQARGLFGGGSDTTGGALHVRTTRMTSGYLRPNGVPYSDNAVMQEYFRSFTLPGDAGTWLIVTTIVDDPEYLTTEFIYSSQFRRETGRSGWNPGPCDIPAPLIDEPLYVPGPFG